MWLVRFRINTAMGKSEERSSRTGQCGILLRTDGGKRASILSVIKIYSGFALKVSLMGCAVSVWGNAYSAPISFIVPRSVISILCSLIPHAQNLYCSFFRRRSRSETLLLRKNALVKKSVLIIRVRSKIRLVDSVGQREKPRHFGRADPLYGHLRVVRSPAMHPRDQARAGRSQQ